MRDRVKQYFIDEMICSDDAAEIIVNEMVSSRMICNETNIPKLVYSWLAMTKSVNAIQTEFWNRAAIHFEIKD